MAVSKRDPLAFMTRVSRAVCVREPQIQHDGHGPNVVVLLGWMAARDIHLAKYAQEYIRIYPASTLVVITARTAILRRPALADSDVLPAVSIIRKATDDTRNPSIHIHLFSNGGSCLLITLYRLFSRIPTCTAMPKHVTIFDSAPWTQYDYSKSVVAVMAGIPEGIVKMIVGPHIRLVCLLLYIRYRLFGGDVFKTWATIHNDKRVVNEKKRIYIYSESDALVPYADVDSHARDATRKGFDVRKELFTGSAHVAHARVDGERYWNIVQSLWKDQEENAAPSEG